MKVRKRPDSSHHDCTSRLVHVSSHVLHVYIYTIYIYIYLHMHVCNNVCLQINIHTYIYKNNIYIYINLTVHI